MTPIERYVRRAYDVGDAAVSLSTSSGRGGCDGTATVLVRVDGEPLVVCQLARSEQSSIQHRYRAMTLLRNLTAARASVRDTIPEPHDVVEVAGRRALFQEHLAGTSAKQYLSVTDRATTLLPAATDWLVRFQRTLADRWVFDADAKRAALANVGCDGTGYADAFVADEFFLAPVHGDLVASNLVVDGTTIGGVIDFENFSREGVPLYDFVTLLLSVGRHVWGHSRRTIDRLFFERNWLSDCVDDCVTRYCRGVGIDRASFVRTLPLATAIALDVADRWNLPRRVATFLTRLHERLLADRDAIVWA